VPEDPGKENGAVVHTHFFIRDGPPSTEIKGFLLSLIYTGMVSVTQGMEWGTQQLVGSQRHAMGFGY